MEEDSARGLQSLEGDDWIGANVVWTGLDRERFEPRMQFFSADQRNDWTAELRLYVGPA